jgi:hypothetical protein
MIQNGRVASLMARKAQLEAELQQESSRKCPDMIRLTTLKRRKLVVKQEIEQLTQQAA